MTEDKTLAEIEAKYATEPVFSWFCRACRAWGEFVDRVVAHFTEARRRVRSSNPFVAFAHRLYIDVVANIVVATLTFLFAPIVLVSLGIIVSIAYLPATFGWHHPSTAQLHDRMKNSYMQNSESKEKGEKVQAPPQQQENSCASNSEAKPSTPASQSLTQAELAELEEEENPDWYNELPEEELVLTNLTPEQALRLVEYIDPRRPLHKEETLLGFTPEQLLKAGDRLLRKHSRG